MRAFLSLHGAYLGFWIAMALIVLAYGYALVFLAIGLARRRLVTPILDALRAVTRHD